MRTAKAVTIWVAWFLTELALGLAAAAAGSGRDFSEDSGPSRLTGVVLLALGIGILWLAGQQWRTRPRGDDEPEDPGWLRGLDDLSLTKIFATGVVLTVANTKNLPMAIGAGTVITRADLEAGSTIIAATTFAVLSSLLLALPIVIFFALGDRATSILTSMRTWLRYNGNVVMAVVLALIGLLLVGESLKAF